MGTSTSSTGPGSGVPYTPPGASEEEQPDSATDPVEKTDKKQPADKRKPRAVPLAPRARFGTARQWLGDFAQSGNSASLRRGIANYTEKGLGGAQRAVQRMGHAAIRSGALFDALVGLRDGTFDPTELGLEATELAGLPTKEIISRVARHLSPSDGTLDSESSHRAIYDALSDLLATHPDADITSLSKNQVDWILERHVANEIFQRIELDVGKSVRSKAPSPVTVRQRRNEIREYVKETVSANFQTRVKKTTKTLNRSKVKKLAKSVMQKTFRAFEDNSK